MKTDTSDQKVEELKKLGPRYEHRVVTHQLTFEATPDHSLGKLNDPSVSWRHLFELAWKKKASLDSRPRPFAQPQRIVWRQALLHGIALQKYFLRDGSVLGKFGVVAGRPAQGLRAGLEKAQGNVASLDTAKHSGVWAGSYIVDELGADSGDARQTEGGVGDVDPLSMTIFRLVCPMGRWRAQGKDDPDGKDCEGQSGSPFSKRVGGPWIAGLSVAICDHLLRFVESIHFFVLSRISKR